MRLEKYKIYSLKWTVSNSLFRELLISKSISIYKEKEEILLFRSAEIITISQLNISNSDSDSHTNVHTHTHS